MIRRNTALLVATLALTLTGVASCHVSASCDVHRDNSGSCSVTVPPNGVLTIVPTTTAAAGGGATGGLPPAPTTTTAPTLTTTEEPSPGSGPTGTQPSPPPAD